MRQTSPTALLSAVLLAASGLCLADTIQVVDEDFDDSLTAFSLQPNATANATADIFLADVAGSQGVVYAGTWQIAPGTIESSSGVVVPQLPPNANFQLDPAEVDGVVSVTYTVDAVLNGFPGDSIGNLFLVLVIYQINDQGQLEVFTQRGVTTLVENTTLQPITVDLAVKDFGDAQGRPPDLGPDGGLLSFGIQLGALFDDSVFTGAGQGHLSIDNWQVFVEVPDRIHQDRFEISAEPRA